MATNTRGDRGYGKKQRSPVTVFSRGKGSDRLELQVDVSKRQPVTSVLTHSEALELIADLAKCLANPDEFTIRQGGNPIEIGRPIARRRVEV